MATLLNTSNHGIVALITLLDSIAPFTRKQVVEVSKPIIIKGTPSPDVVAAAAALKDEWQSYNAGSLELLVREVVKLWKIYAWSAPSTRRVQMIYRSDDRGQAIDETMEVPFLDLENGFYASPDALLYTDNASGDLKPLSFAEAIEHPLFDKLTDQLIDIRD